MIKILAKKVSSNRVNKIVGAVQKPKIEMPNPQQATGTGCTGGIQSCTHCN